MNFYWSSYNPQPGYACKETYRGFAADPIGGAGGIIPTHPDPTNYLALIIAGRILAIT